MYEISQITSEKILRVANNIQLKLLRMQHLAVLFARLSPYQTVLSLTLISSDPLALKRMNSYCSL